MVDEARAEAFIKAQRSQQFLARFQVIGKMIEILMISILMFIILHNQQTAISIQKELRTGLCISGVTAPEACSAVDRRQIQVRQQRQTAAFVKLMRQTVCEEIRRARGQDVKACK